MNYFGCVLEVVTGLFSDPLALIIFRTLGAYYFQNPWRLIFSEPLALIIFRTLGAYYFQNHWRLLFSEPLALIIFNIKIALSYVVLSNHILHLVFQRGEMVN